MTTMTTPTELRRPALKRTTAMRLAATEYDRVADAIAALSPDDWTRPTDCPAWDVRQMCCHVVGMAEMATGMRETMRQQKAAGKRLAGSGGPFIDALTGLQVDERSDWTPAQVVAGARAVGPRAARGRRRTPGFLRRRPMPGAQHVNGVDEAWSLGFLLDVVLTRDPWMHRMDLARATGTAPVLTADHDGVLVADIVAEWAARHGRPYDLTLTGPAGGHWAHGSGGETVTMDAVEFCRVLSGRGSGTGLLSTHVPF
jgi:uncharacterized protein (TIGR03083 family)